MTIRRSMPRLRPQLEALAAGLILSTIAVITLMACGRPDAPEDSTGRTTTGQAAPPASNAPTGKAMDISHQDGDAHDADHAEISTATVDQAAPGEGGNAHVINTTPPATFDPNAIADPVDRNDPAKVAAAYLLARLECDSNSISIADCLGKAADLSEPDFGRLLREKAQNADSWRQQVLANHLVVTVRIDDIAIQTSGNGYLVTIAYTRTVSSDLVRRQAPAGIVAVTVEPDDTGDWWVTGDSGLGAG